MANFYDAFARGQANGLERQKAVTQRNMLAELQQIGPQVIAGDLAATDRAYALDPDRAKAFQAEGNRQQQQLFGLAKSLKQSAANPQMQAGIYRSAVPFLKRSFGAEIPDEFDAASVMPIVDQVLAVAENAPSMGIGGNVQSTYIDGNGNRVAILRDGSQRVLGPNNASIRVMEQEGALPYGVVTSGGRPGAVVDIGGGQATMQGATGQYTIDPSLPPEVQQQIRAAEAAGQQVPSNMVLPPRSGPVPIPTAAQRAYGTEAGRNQAQNDNFANTAEQDRILKEQQARIDAERARAVEQAKSEQERISNERAKSAQLNNVDRGLTRIDQAMKALSGRFVDTGPIDGRIIGPTPQGQELEAAVGAIQNDMLALTRVPGIGSQSDLEAKIANLKYPSIYNAPEVNARNVEQLKAFMKDLRQQIQTSPSQGAPSAPAGRSVTRRGRASDGRAVVQYSDGTIEYGN
jgi:hypothetical protein